MGRSSSNITHEHKAKEKIMDQKQTIIKGEDDNRCKGCYYASDNTVQCLPCAECNRIDDKAYTECFDWYITADKKQFCV